MTEIETTPYLPESVDKKAPFVLTTEYCTGRVTLDYPVNKYVTLRRYIKQIQRATADAESITAESHIRRVVFYKMNDDGEQVILLDTKHEIPSCDCSPLERGSSDGEEKSPE